MPKYNKKTVKAITDLIKKDTYTIAEICASVGISESCFYNWQSEHGEFGEAITQARIDANMRFVKMARKSLAMKLEGYEVEETKTVYGNDITGKPKIKEKQVIKKHFQPDTQAIVFALTNLDGDNWKNKQTNELTGKDGKDLIPQKPMSREEAKKYLDDLEKEV